MFPNPSKFSEYYIVVSPSFCSLALIEIFIDALLAPTRLLDIWNVFQLHFLSEFFLDIIFCFHFQLNVLIRIHNFWESSDNFSKTLMTWSILVIHPYKLPTWLALKLVCLNFLSCVWVIGFDLVLIWALLFTLLRSATILMFFSAPGQ